MMATAAGTLGAGPATRPSFTVGHLDDKRLGELSGLVSSPKHPGLFWGHNDSGNPAELFTLTRDGHVVATIPVAGAPNVDWEDIALDESGRLYVADTGNNDRRRREVYVYRFDEPDPTKAAPVRPTAHWTLRYPAQPFDCEALFIRGQWGYLLPKLRSLLPPTLYRFPLDAPPGRPITLEALGTLPAVTGPVTAADVSPDGHWLAVLTVLGPYVFQIDGDPLRAVNAPAAAGHATFVAPRMESACFVPDGLLAGTEEGDLYLFTWDDLGMKRPK
jgi:hypothetical protein